MNALGGVSGWCPSVILGFLNKFVGLVVKARRPQARSAAAILRCTHAIGTSQTRRQNTHGNLSEGCRSQPTPLDIDVLGRQCTGINLISPLGSPLLNILHDTSDVCRVLSISEVKGALSKKYGKAFDCDEAPRAPNRENYIAELSRVWFTMQLWIMLGFTASPTATSLAESLGLPGKDGKRISIGAQATPTKTSRGGW